MNRLLFVLRLALSFIICGAVLLQLRGIYPRAINAAVPLVGVLMLLQGLSEWKTNRSAAWLSFCAAGFIFIVSLAVFFL